MSNPEITNTKSQNKTTKIAIRDMTPEQTAETIKNIAKNIREGSHKMREAVKFSARVVRLTNLQRQFVKLR